MMFHHLQWMHAVMAGPLKQHIGLLVQIGKARGMNPNLSAYGPVPVKIAVHMHQQVQS
jgi:hypothetical protein